MDQDKITTAVETLRSRNSGDIILLKGNEFIEFFPAKHNYYPDVYHLEDMGVTHEEARVAIEKFRKESDDPDPEELAKELALGIISEYKNFILDYYKENSEVSDFETMTDETLSETVRGCAEGYFYSTSRRDLNWYMDILEDLSDYEESDSGLWDNDDWVDSIRVRAAYTLENAVYHEVESFFTELESEMYMYDNPTVEDFVVELRKALGETDPV